MVTARAAEVRVVHAGVALAALAAPTASDWSTAPAGGGIGSHAERCRGRGVGAGRLGATADRLGRLGACRVHRREAHQTASEAEVRPVAAFGLYSSASVRPQCGLTHLPYPSYPTLPTVGSNAQSIDRSIDYSAPLWLSCGERNRGAQTVLGRACACAGWRRCQRALIRSILRYPQPNRRKSNGTFSADVCAWPLHLRVHP